MMNANMISHNKRWPRSLILYVKKLMIRMKFSCYNNIAVKKIKKLIIINNNVKP